jgi:hypothetical protein
MMMLLNLNAAINSIFSGSVFLNDPHNWCDQAVAELAS